ncbi:MAG: pyrroline-5-carboxylate reductase family protein [Brevinematia bacterium]
MCFKSIGFVGGGRIVRIILEGVKNRNFNLETISVYDCNKEALNCISVAFPKVETVDTLEKLGGRDLIILAIHPPVMMDTLVAIKPLLTEKSTILSLVPKITIAKMKEKLGGFGRIARCNPNLTSIINKGFNPICFSEELSENERNAILSLLDGLGKTPVVKEESLEAYAVISTMLPTYLWFMWDEICKLGVNFGLGENEVKDVLKEVVPAAIEVYLKDGMDAYNLIPARPLKDDEESIRNIFETKLKGVYEKLKN